MSRLSTQIHVHQYVFAFLGFVMKFHATQYMNFVDGFII